MDDWVDAVTASGTLARTPEVHAPLLTNAEQQQRRDWFRGHLQHGVLFNQSCKFQVEHWGSDRVEILMPYSDELSGHVDVFHGGVICALIDTCGSGAIMAGHDFNKGSRLTTVSLAVQYLSAAPGEDALAVARCSRRGRSLHFCDVEVFSAPNGQQLASGQLTAKIAGERPGVPGVILDSRADN